MDERTSEVELACYERNLATGKKVTLFTRDVAMLVNLIRHLQGELGRQPPDQYNVSSARRQVLEAFDELRAWERLGESNLVSHNLVEEEAMNMARQQARVKYVAAIKRLVALDDIARIVEG